MIQQQLEELRREYAAVLQEAESDVRDHQQFAARRAETGRDAERVAQFLRQHHEDRPQANERYRSAADCWNGYGGTVQAGERIGSSCSGRWRRPLAC